MKPISYEYRLRWQRLGLAPVSRILQTEKGAVEKAERMLRLDEVKGTDEIEGSYGLLPDLVWMRLERRPVGAWADVRTFDVPEPDPDSERQVVSALGEDDVPW